MISIWCYTLCYGGGQGGYSNKEIREGSLEKMIHETDFGRQMEFQQVADGKKKNPVGGPAFAKVLELSRACLDWETEYGRNLGLVRTGGGRRHRTAKILESDFVTQTVKAMRVWGSNVSDPSADLWLMVTSDEPQVHMSLGSLGQCHLLILMKIAGICSKCLHHCHHSRGFIFIIISLHHSPAKQIRKLKLREVKSPPWGHPANEWWS